MRVVYPEWPVRADGACVYLDQLNRCSIYEVRPLVCRIDESRPPEMSIEEWHRLNADGCETLQIREGLDPAVWKPKL